MSTFFEGLRETTLKRGKDLYYTLGDKSLDRLFGLDQVSAAFIPDDSSVKQLAAAVYLYGISGFVTSNFTAVPAGYLVCFENEDKTIF